jgi:hypothetical protein
MSRFLTLFLSGLTFLSLHPQLAARPPGRVKTSADPRIAVHDRTSNQALADRQGLFVSTAVDTYVIAEFGFGTINPDPFSDPRCCHTARLASGLMCFS